MKALYFIGQLFIATAIAALAGVLFVYQPLVARSLELKARHDCAQDYKLEFTDSKTGTTVIQPVEDLYRQCLENAGIE